MEYFNYIKNLNNLYAHVKDSRQEHLEDHINLAYKYFIKIINENNLKDIFENLENSLIKDYSDDFKKIWNDMLVNTIPFHDFGKINPNFQHYRMQNKTIDKIKGFEEAKHSLFSSCLYIDYYLPKIYEFYKSHTDEPKETYELFLFMYINSYLIAKHHGYLEEFIKFKEKILDEIDKINSLRGKDLLRYLNKKFDLNEKNINNSFLWNKVDCKNVLKFLWNNDQLVEKEWDENIYYYIYSKLLFSLLVACDFYSTYEFMNMQEVKNFGNTIETEKLLNEFKKTKEYKNIENYTDEKEKNIDDLRCEMFLEAQKNFLGNFNNNIFYLEAPTGSGKTITSINLCLKALEKDKNIKKIFYVFPFNTLVEQTKDSILRCFGESIEKDVAVINSVTPIKYIDKNEDNKILNGNKSINYEEMLLDREFLHYPIVLTTHVSFFNILFGTSRESVFPLIHLANSIIVLDEIQSYKNDIWIEIIGFLEKYAKVLNLKIIIMSATLPKLDELLKIKISSQILIRDREKYFKNPLFKDRVKPDFSLLEVNGKEEVFCSIEKLIKEEYGNEKVDILIEFITRRSAREFYKRLKNLDLNKEVILFTGDDNTYERKRIINKIKDKKREKNIILVATQIIEAGIDVDFHIGFKNLSILDAEEQFSGRINRSFKRSFGTVYFFDIGDKNPIKNDRRCENQYSLINEEMQELFINKDFNKYYSDYIFKTLKNYKNKGNFNGLNMTIKQYLNNLDFDGIKKHMELINDDIVKYYVFFDRDVFIDGLPKFSGGEVWNEYKSVLKDSKMSYAKKRVELSKIQAKMEYFTYVVYNNNFPYEDVIGDIFYFGKGDQYFEGGKFDGEKFDSDKFI